MIRKFFVLFFLLLSISGFSRGDQSPQKFKKKSAASDSFRSRVKALADSIQKNRVSIDPVMTAEKVQPDTAPVVQPETGKDKKEDSSWLLLAAGAAVLGAFFFLFRRKRK